MVVPLLYLAEPSVKSSAEAAYCFLSHRSSTLLSGEISLN